jgi:eukaryotic-like serine/threonine-protein kinase
VNLEGKGQAADRAATPKACPSCGARYSADALFCALDGSPLTTSPSAVAAAAATDPYVGREILGHIEIRQLVGIGAMGRVYRAFQKGIDRDVAVKILHRELSANPTVVSRFNREAKVASRLAHPHVVHVLLVGQLPDGAMYIVMEYLDGMSLQSALAAAGGAMPLPRALHIAVKLCDAAGEAHAQGIVHRDLKPENIMLVDRADDPDFVKVLDFGIARLNWGEQSIATAAGLIFGTARYISPEAAQGEQVGPQGDVYSIATMVYQMLAGRTPFDADQVVAVLVQQIHDPPPHLNSIPRAVYVPEPIATAVMKNLAKRAADRAEDARTFGRELLEAAMISGLSAQDILTRPAVRAGTRGSGAVQLPSIQRTDKHQLEPDVAARIDARGPPRSGTEALQATKTAFETPVEPGVEGWLGGSEGRTVQRTEIVPDGSPAGMATARWAAPENLDAKSLAPPSSRMPPPQSKPPSAVEATMADAEAPSRRGPARALLLMVACFFVGALGMAAVAWQAGMFGKGSTRALPSAASSPAATGPEAAHLGGEGSSEQTPTVESSLPPLMSAHTPGTTPSATAATRAVIDASSAKPAIGQPVDFAAHVLGPAGGGRAKTDGAHFRIAGPGIAAGTDLPVADDGSGVFHTTFTFLQNGRFEVTFMARVDGAPVRTARVVVVDSTPGLPPAPAASSAPGPAPPASAKWL